MIRLLEKLIIGHAEASGPTLELSIRAVHGEQPRIAEHVFVADFEVRDATVADRCGRERGNFVGCLHFDGDAPRIIRDALDAHVGQKRLFA